MLDIKQDNLQKYKTKTAAPDGDERSNICLTSFRKKGENYKKKLLTVFADYVIQRMLSWIYM